jgi:hypothetical protein
MGNVLGPPVNHWKYSVLTPFMLTSFPRLVLCVNSYDRPLDASRGPGNENIYYAGLTPLDSTRVVAVLF